MSFLDWSYIGLLVASFLGAVLFFGYTFRFRIKYPFALVTLHLTTVLITFVLFTIAFVQILTANPSLLKTGFIILTYVVFILTLLTGLFFFVRYDLRRKIMRLPLVSTHIVMAVFTFICFTGVMGLYMRNNQVHKPVLVGRNSPGWYSFHRHQTIHHITHPSGQ